MSMDVQEDADMLECQPAMTFMEAAEKVIADMEKLRRSINALSLRNQVLEFRLSAQVAAGERLLEKLKKNGCGND